MLNLYTSIGLVTFAFLAVTYIAACAYDAADSRRAISPNKSRIIADYARQHGIRVYSVPAVECEPSDLRGYPSPSNAAERLTALCDSSVREFGAPRFTSYPNDDSFHASLEKPVPLSPAMADIVARFNESCDSVIAEEVHAESRLRLYPAAKKWRGMYLPMVTIRGDKGRMRGSLVPQVNRDSIATADAESAKLLARRAALRAACRSNLFAVAE